MDPYGNREPPQHPHWNTPRTGRRESSESSSSADNSFDEESLKPVEQRPPSKSIENLALDLSYLSLDETGTECSDDSSMHSPSDETLGAVGTSTSFQYPKGARPKEYFGLTRDTSNVSRNLQPEQDVPQRPPGSRPLYGSQDSSSGGNLSKEPGVIGGGRPLTPSTRKEDCSHLLYSPPRDMTWTDQHGHSPTHSPNTNRKILSDISQRYGACGNPTSNSQSLTAHFPPGYTSSGLDSIWFSTKPRDFDLETHVDDFFDDIESRLRPPRPSTPHPPFNTPEKCVLFDSKGIWSDPSQQRSYTRPPGSVPNPSESGFPSNTEQLLDANRNASQMSPLYGEEAHSDELSFQSLSASVEDLLNCMSINEDYQNLNTQKKHSNEVYQRANDDENANVPGPHGKDKGTHEDAPCKRRKIKLTYETCEAEYLSAYEEEKAKNKEMPNSMKFVPSEKAVFKAKKEGPLYKQAIQISLFWRMFNENVTKEHYRILDEEIISLTNDIAAMEGFNPGFFDDFVQHDEAKFNIYKQLLVEKEEKVIDYLLIGIYLAGTGQIPEVPSMEYR